MQRLVTDFDSVSRMCAFTVCDSRLRVEPRKVVHPERGQPGVAPDHTHSRNVRHRDADSLILH